MVRITHCHSKRIKQFANRAIGAVVECVDLVRMGDILVSLQDFIQKDVQLPVLKDSIALPPPLLPYNVQQDHMVMRLGKRLTSVLVYVLRDIIVHQVLKGTCHEKIKDMFRDQYHHFPFASNVQGFFTVILFLTN